MTNLDRRRFVAALALVAPGFPARAAEKIPVVATFSILADLVAQVGGERVAVTPIIGPDMDAHVYEPTPADARKVTQAKLVVVNGLGFESWAERLLNAAKYQGVRLVASQGITPLAAHDDGHGHGSHDPHAWQDVGNVKIYVANIRDALIAADPDGAETYKARALAYLKQLEALDGEIRGAVAAVPRERRKVITSHDAFAYYGAAYGVEFLSPQGKNTASEASAKDVARLIRQIKAERVKAVFIENMANRKVVDQITRETGAKLGGTLYADALGGPARTYLEMMRHNTLALAAAMS